MAAPWIDPTLCLVGTVGVGGSACGLYGLLAPCPARGAWKVVPWAVGALGAGLCVLAILLRQPPTTWGPLAGLLGVVAALTAVRSAAARRVFTALGPVVRSPRIQAAALVLCGPALAILSIPPTVAGDDFDMPAQDFDLVALPPLKEIQPCPVTTDRGRPVSVYVSQDRQTFTPEFLGRQSAFLRNRGFMEHIIRVPDGDTDCNCHGWVFTDGRFWLSPEGVELILADNGYRPSETPGVGDLVVYRSRDGKLLHTGILRAGVESGIVLVESKWGVLGRFVHSPDIHPYGDCLWTCHRTARLGHRLNGLPGDTPPAAQVSGEPALTSSARLE
jgi:hypothetical protein